MPSSRALSKTAALALIAAILMGCSGGESVGPAGPAPPPPPPPPPAPPALPSTLAGKIVFVHEGELAIMNTDGTGILELGVSGFAHDVSPDGTRIAYTTDPVTDVAVYDLGTQTTTLFATQGENRRPNRSPDGEKILFVSTRTGAPELWVMNVDGSNVTRLTRGGGTDAEGDWSPDGTKIAFRRDTGDGGDIWVMDADGNNQVELYAGPGQDTSPQWSPDGTRIAFDGVRGRNVDIFLIDADGTNPVRVTSHAAADWSPRWSPDGTRIAFFAHPGASDEVREGQDTTLDLFTVAADGSEADVELLLGGPTRDQQPVYGPEP